MHLPTLCHPSCAGWSLCHEADAVRARLAARQPSRPEQPKRNKRTRSYGPHHAFVGTLLILTTICSKFIVLAMA